MSTGQHGAPTPDPPPPAKRPAFEPAARLLTPTGYDPDMERPTSIVAGTALWFILALGGTVLAIDLLLTIFVFLGRNWARVIVMVIAVMSISTSFVAWWAQGQEIEIEGTFLSLSLDILLLLALSSRSSAAYARRYEHR